MRRGASDKAPFGAMPWESPEPDSNRRIVLKKKNARTEIRAFPFFELVVARDLNERHAQPLNNKTTAAARTSANNNNSFEMRH